MWCAISRQTRLANYPSLLVGEYVIDPSISVRNLGVQLRSDLMINDQISTVVRSCNYNIRQLRAIRSFLSRDALRDVAYRIYLRISREILGKIICKNWGGGRLIPGARHQTKKTALEHGQNGYNAIYMRLTLD